jgi:hypothetical protein
MESNSHRIASHSSDVGVLTTTITHRMALVTVFLIKTLAAISLAQSIKLAAVLRNLQEAALKFGAYKRTMHSVSRNTYWVHK